MAVLTTARRCVCMTTVFDRRPHLDAVQLRPESALDDEDWREVTDELIMEAGMSMSDCDDLYVSPTPRCVCACARARNCVCVWGVGDQPVLRACSRSQGAMQPCRCCKRAGQHGELCRAVPCRA